MSGLARELVRSVAGTGLVPRLVTQHPRPQWWLGGLVVVVGEERADIRYARMPAGWAKPHAADIVEGVQRAGRRLATRSLSPDELLPKLAAGYAKLLARARKRGGERVSLVELRDEIGGMTRAQFAWDLARLRRERRLTIGDARIDLGVATGHTATKRSRVVWIEDDRGGGTYYESFRLLDSKERHDDQSQATPTTRVARSRAGAPHPRPNGRKR